MKQAVSSSETGTRSVERAADIIKALGGSAQGRNLTELARVGELSKATTYRILQTLLKEGLVDYRDDTGTYVIGIELVRIAMESRAGAKLSVIQGIENLSAPYMQRLCESTGETVALVMSLGDVRTNVAVNLGSHELIASPKVGAQLPLHTGGPGKVILAFYTPEELEKFIQRSRFDALTPNTISSPELLKKELRQIRRDGYATSASEAVEGQHSIAAPILKQGKVVAAINLIVPTVRFSRERQSDLLPQVQSVAAEISRLISKT
jgi:DNA-binding IclR family transcriptional regulator